MTHTDHTNTHFQTLLAESKPGLHPLRLHAACDELCHEAGQAGWQCYCVDGLAVHDKASFLSAIAGALRFPSYFGHNWDAFEECLNDLSWESTASSKGFVILFDKAGGFAHAHPDDWATARSIFTDAARAWKKNGRPMLIFVRGVRLDE
jgi:hypothetical protein